MKQNVSTLIVNGFARGIFSLEISIFYKYLCACGPVRLIGFTTFCLLAAFPGNRFICYLEFCRPSESNIFIKRAVNVSKVFEVLCSDVLIGVSWRFPGCFLESLGLCEFFGGACSGPKRTARKYSRLLFKVLITMCKF